ncbi:MAG TPA: SCO family protein [Candidatus Kapabacteria bacterium]|nr:SCO family protein [Candidatus Kapabacteria bacterium]
MKISQHFQISFGGQRKARRPPLVLCYSLLVTLLFTSSAMAQEAPFFKGDIQGEPAAEGLPKIVQHVDFIQHLGARVDLTLPVRDENGNTTTLGTYFGSTPVILVMAYYGCPHLCTVVMNGVFSGLSPLSLDPGKDFQVVSVSINPNEGAALATKKKQSYLEDFHQTEHASAYHFLTAPESTIETLTKEVGFQYAYDSVHQQYAHAAGIMVLTPQGTISRYFYGVEFAPNDLKFGLMDASGGKVGTLADKILLFCCQYDPTTSKYGFVIARALMIGGTLMIIAMGIMFYWLHRRVKKAASLRSAEIIGSDRGRSVQIRNA